MTPYDKNNVFARILRQELPASIVYEDEYALACHDLYPHAPIHVLVIPKGEFVSFSDFATHASPDLIIGLTRAIHQVAKLLNLEENGFRLVVNQGTHGGQDVPHYHVHILGGAPLPSCAPKK